MRISDWSSDVCSSDLDKRPDERPKRQRVRVLFDCFAQWHRLHLDLRPGIGGTWQKGCSLSRTTNSISSCSVICCGRMRSEEHTSELQSLMRISYAVFCLKKTNTNTKEPKNKQLTFQ